jgi:carnitine 3-dehydrogenase
MEPPPHVKKVAIVGTGIIGSGWAALFCAKGYTVVAFVRSPSSKTKFLNNLQAAWHKLLQRGLASEPQGYQKVACIMNLAECVADVDYVQESVVEELSLKQHIIQEIDEFAPPNAIIGSSTSFIPLSLVRLRAKRRPERVAIAHPTQPQWDAFCEVLGSSAPITHWLSVLFGPGGLDMDVVNLKKEGHGHALNFLLLAMTGASQILLQSGVCDCKDLDVAAKHLAQVLVAAGGYSSTMVGVVGGGSSEATTELGSDIVLGTPIAWGAICIGRTLPSFLARPALWILQFFWWPLRTQLLKRLARKAVAWVQKDLYSRFDESTHHVTAFETNALKRMTAMEASGADEQKPACID